MNDYDLIPADDGGDLVPSHRTGTGLPQSSPAPANGNAPEWYVPPGDSPHGLSAQVVGGLFGVAIPGVSVRDLQANFVVPVAQRFTADLTQLGVDAPYITAMARWFTTYAQRPLKAQYATHNYDLSGFDIQPDDRVPLVNFLNAMDDAGVPQDVMRLALSWYWVQLPKILQQAYQPQQSPSVPAGNYSLYDQLDDKTAIFVENRSEKDRQVCENQLRTRWGDNYQNNVEAVARYVNKLPPQDQHFIHNAVARDGVLILNDPSVFEELWRTAVGVNAPSADINAEIAEIEKLMRTDRAAYRRDERIQSRYLELLRMRG